MSQAQHGYRWVIFAAMAAVYCAFGAMVMSIPPMVGEVRDDLGVGRGAMGFALGAWALIFIATAPPAGRVIDRIGLRWSLTLGAGFIVASGLARSAAQGLGTMWFAIAIFGIGGPLVSTSAPKLVAIWFDDAAERRLAVGIYAAAPAIGSILALSLTNSFLLPTLGSWRAVLVADSLFALVAGFIWFGVSTAAPPEPFHEATSSAGGSSEHEGAWRTLLADRGVQLAIALGVGTFFVNHGLGAWLPETLETEVGLSATAASNWAATALVLGVFANLVVPRAASDARRNQVLAWVMATVGLGLIVMVTAPQPVALAATMLVGARAVLVPLVILVLMSARSVEPANMGAANGVWFAFAEIGGTTGPLVVGAIGDTSAGFTGAMVLLACVLAGLVGLVAWDSLSKPPR